MLVIEDNFKQHIEYKTIIALGGFDGLHLGHRALLDKTISASKKLKCKSMVFTFKNHPLTIINKESAPKPPLILFAPPFPVIMLSNSFPVPDKPALPSNVRFSIATPNT